jgi:hypothetical protein
LIQFSALSISMMLERQDHSIFAFHERHDLLVYLHSPSG